VRAAVAGAVVGVLVAVVVARALGPEPAPSPAAAAAFLDAWARHRTATYVAEGTFTRTLDGEPALESAVRTVQRPPDRLELQPGSATGRLGGRRVACAVEDDGSLSCRTGERVGPYEDAVAREVAILRDQVEGPRRVYDVTEDGDCFVLELGAGGERSTYCFDGATGALVRSRIERGRLADTVVMTSVRPEVTDEDLSAVTGQG
jgi:hypothetical protein